MTNRDAPIASTARDGNGPGEGREGGVDYVCGWLLKVAVVYLTVFPEIGPDSNQNEENLPQLYGCF